MADEEEPWKISRDQWVKIVTSRGLPTLENTPENRAALEPSIERMKARMQERRQRQQDYDRWRAATLGSEEMIPDAEDLLALNDED